MGSGRWTDDTYVAYAASTNYRAKSTHEVFSSSHVNKTLNSQLIKLRESRDSADNPQSTPLIFALDVTGSMGRFAADIAKNELPKLMTRVLKDLPVTDPHIMFMGVDDILSSPSTALQVSQFEADIRIVEQLREIFLVGRGGGNGTESYDLPWYFAGHRTSIDSMSKRNKRGYLFTFGDENAPNYTLSPSQLQQVFGPGEYRTTTSAEALEKAREQYNVFHICIEQGSGFGRDSIVTWTELLGNNVLFLSDINDLDEVVIATLRICEGADINEVINDSKTPSVLKHAFKNALKNAA